MKYVLLRWPKNGTIDILRFVMKNILMLAGLVLCARVFCVYDEPGLKDVEHVGVLRPTHLCVPDQAGEFKKEWRADKTLVQKGNGHVSLQDCEVIGRFLCAIDNERLSSVEKWGYYLSAAHGNPQVDNGHALSDCLSMDSVVAGELKHYRPLLLSAQKGRLQGMCVSAFRWSCVSNAAQKRDFIYSSAKTSVISTKSLSNDASVKRTFYRLFAASDDKGVLRGVWQTSVVARWAWPTLKGAVVRECNAGMRAHFEAFKCVDRMLLNYNVVSQYMEDLLELRAPAAYSDDLLMRYDNLIRHYDQMKKELGFIQASLLDIFNSCESRRTSESSSDGTD